MGNRLDRIALVVDDVAEVAADLEEILGIPFVTRDLPAMGIKVGLGDDGIELVERTGPSSVEHFWRGALAALVIRVEDIEASSAAMIAAGYPLDHSLTTPAGIQERHFGNSFHGIPLVLYTGTASLTADGDDPAHSTPDVVASPASSLGGAAGGAR
jgi:hypothetical protein